MEMLQGNTYLKPVRVEDSKGNVVTADRVAKVEIVFGDLYKYYGTEGGEVYWDALEKCFIVPLTEEDTFSLEGAVECQVRAVLVDGSVSGSKPEGHYVYESKSKTRLTEGGAGAESGELLTLKLLKEFTYVGGGSGSGGIVEETDPTVPEFVKRITEGDIASWNAKLDKISATANNDRVYIVKSDGTQGTMVVTNGLDANAIVRRGNGGQFASPEPTNDLHVANKGYVDRKVADLVDSAPETLDTLGEVAQAIKDNEDVVDALNSAIGERLKKDAITLTLKDNGAYTLTINKG